MIAYSDYTDYIDLNERSRAKAAAGRNERFRLSAPKYARAYREAFIYDIINYVDQNCIPDDAIDVEGYVQPKLTFEEKRRLRNRIVTKLYERGIDNPEALYDASAIADIFFNETDYGKKHSSYKTEWEKNGKLFKEHEQNIREWTLEQDGEPEKCLISPYDPYFSSSGLCTGRRESEYGDQIGYIIEADIPEEDEEDDSAVSFRCLNESGYIQSVYVGDHNMIADAGKADEIAENNTSAKGLNQVRYIEDRYDRAGYGIFRRFINSKTDDDNIRKFIP